MESPTEFVDRFAGLLGTKLRERKSAFSDEMRLHDAVEAVLAELGEPAQREYRLNERDRLDFYLLKQEIAIEVKKGLFGIGDYRQLGRYLEHPQVRGVIAIGLRFAPNLPGAIIGKPVAHLPLWPYML